MLRIFCDILERKLKLVEITPTTVTQGKTIIYNKERNPAAHAVDKDLSTQAATETDNRAGWLTLEFDRTHFIHKMHNYSWLYTNWYWPTNWYALSEVNFKACVNYSNNIDVSVYQGGVKQGSCGTL